eukprot:scaffold3.g6695.t1
MGQPRWLDAQPFLARVCAGMAVGELLHGPHFSLYEAMTAIEIGDAKMDIGLAREPGCGSVEELVAAGGAPLDLDGRQLLALFDQLLVLEATWHCHAMLPQTLFASLYMLDVERLQPNLVLHAFCAGVRSTASLVNDMVVSGQVCEDEDFFVHTFGIEMLDPPGPQPPRAALQALAAAEEWLETQAVAGSSGGGGRPAAGKAGGGKGKHRGQAPHKAQAAAAAQQQEQQAAARGQEPRQRWQDMGSDVAAALLVRVRLRRMVLEALVALQQFGAAAVEQAARLAELAAAEVARVTATAGLAAGVAAPGYVPEVNRKHMGLAPARMVVPLGLEAAAEHFSGLLQALAAACRALLGVQGSWEQLREMLTAFAAQNAHAIVRSAVHLQLAKPLADLVPVPTTAGAAATSPAGQANGSGAATGKQRGERGGVPPWCPSQQMVCKEFGLPPASLPAPEAATFVEQCSIAGWCHVACLNRCRQRRRHRRLLEDWSHMLDHATNADLSEAFQEWMVGAGWRWPTHDEQEAVGPLSTWVVREACGTMLAHLQLGFPLELYQPFEYRSLYWYSDYLLGTQQQTCKLLQATRPPAPATPAGGAARRPGGGRGKAATAPAAAPAAALSERREAVALLRAEVDRMMCQGLFRMATGLIMLGLVPEPPGALSGESERFAQRFGAFVALQQPEPLTHPQYARMMRADGLAPERLLATAHDHFAKVLKGAAVLGQGGSVRAALSEGAAAHLAAISRVATQNMLALKLMVGTVGRAAAARREQAAVAAEGAGDGAGGEQREAEGSGPPTPPPFAISWDLKSSLAQSSSMFYPVLALRSAQAGGRGGKAAAA